jgi:hypothetical protein
MSGRKSTADSGHNTDPQSKMLQGLSMLAKQKELEAMMSPPPMKMTTFASGAINGYMPDVNSMSGIERQIYLPKESGAINGGLSDGQIQGMQAPPDPTWNQKQARNPDSVDNMALLRQLEQIKALMGGGR